MTENVVVYCKLPNGIHLRVDDTVITLQGYNHGLRKDEENPKPILSNGVTYAYVPLEFWESWYQQNKELELVKNRLVWAEKSLKRAKKSSKEEMIKTGFEPLSQDSNPMDFI